MNESSPQNTHIFLHIEKTAGRSINKLLDENFEEDRVLHLYPDPIGENVFDATLKLRRGLVLLMGHVDFGIHEQFAISNPMYFTFVRGPVERLISEFNYFKNRNKALPESKWRRKNRIIDECNSLADFARSPFRIRNPLASRVCGKMFGKPVAFEIAKETIEKWFSFVGVTELMDESLQLMSVALNVNFGKAPRVNQTVRPELPISERERIEEMMRESDAIDFELYSWCVARLKTPY